MSSKISDILIQIFIFASVIIFVLITIIKRFLYFHPSKLLENPHIDVTEVTEGYLHGWILKGSEPYTIFFCHGNGGNISHRQDKLKALNNLGYSVVIFDYTGYGKSKGGVPSETQLYRDASIFFNKLTETQSIQNIIPYGESLGGPVATYIATTYNTPYLILESSLPSVSRLIRTKYPILCWLSPFFTEFNTEKMIKNYTGKTLLLHSSEDEIIPPKSMFIIENYVTEKIIISGGHNSPVIPWEKIKYFIDNK